ncbi:terpenoid synthase [Imleria badia]|nr:terpenoid synthase [Imleria badia]
METYTLFSLGALIGFIIHFTFHAVSPLIARRHKSVVNIFVAEKASATEKHSNKYSPKVFVPDILARWPWPRRINPHFAVVKEESVAWMESFGAFSPKAQHAFNRCDFSRLACLTYPMAKRDHIRPCCDFMSLVFVIDEYSDASEPSEVRKQKDVIMDALHNPHKPRPKGEWIGGEVARQFWELTIRNASKQSQKRFVATFDEYLEAVAQQAIDRSGHRIRDITSYFDIRRDTIGGKPAIALLELGLDIPDEVMSHPAIQEMALAAVDMISIGNDITSYNLEQSRGDDSHSIITIVMNEIGTDVNGAMLWAQDFHTKLEQKFHAAMAALPQWDEPLNSQVKEYCNGLGQWVRGNDDWEFEGGRYFGNRGVEIKEKRWMALMPKQRKNGTPEIGPVLVDSSQL